MVKSMTGYGRAREMRGGRDITVEVRSVNNRYLDCTVKMPRAYIFAEDAIKTRVQKAISRGKVDVFVSQRSEGMPEVTVSLNRDVAAAYIRAMRQMAEEFQIREDISVALVSQMSDVFTVDRPQVDEEQLLADLMQVVGHALEGYDAMRSREGEALKADLTGRGNTIRSLVSQVEEGSPQTVADYRTRLYQKLQEVLANTAIDESRILTEAAIFADKVAVDEETVRLRSHLNQLDQMLTTGGPIGRKLDFLLQEFNRESNTIGSKGNDLEQARTVVDLKAELEKIREQTQNIE